MGQKFERVKSFRKDERGLVGVGVLIIFISIVIVATVAAGILINTSVSIQGQARDTAEAAMQKTSSGVRILGATGKTNENARVENISITVQRRVGSGGIDLSKTTVHYQSGDTDAYLKMENVKAGSGEYPADFFSILGDDNFAVVKILNESGTENYIIGEGADLCEIQIKADKVETDKVGLGRASDLTLVIIPDKGFKTMVNLEMPATLAKNETYNLR